jgi:hypothetical protein
LGVSVVVWEVMSMPRWHVHIVQMRARDVRVGDVVAKDPTRFDGWFRVHETKTLLDGSINIIDKSNERSFTAGPFDLVGLQTPVPLPAEAERNVQREEASRAAAGTPEAGAQSPDAAAREAAAREQANRGARALPGT